MLEMTPGSTGNVTTTNKEFTVQESNRISTILNNPSAPASRPREQIVGDFYWCFWGLVCILNNLTSNSFELLSEFLPILTL